MAGLRLRPRFDVLVPCAIDAYFAQLRYQLEDPQSPCEGKLLGRNLILFLRADRRHTWSPVLDAELQGYPEGVRVVGRIGPHPTVMLLFIAVYAILSFLVLGALLLGTAQLSLGMSAPILWLVPVCLGLIVGVYALAYTGQRIGADQVAELYAFVESAGSPLGLG